MKNVKSDPSTPLVHFFLRKISKILDFVPQRIHYRKPLNLTKKNPIYQIKCV